MSLNAYVRLGLGTRLAKDNSGMNINTGKVKISLID